MPDLFIPNGRGGYSAQGSVASRLLSGGMHPGNMRTLDVLRKEEWIQFDETVIQVAEERLVAAGDLIQRGLVIRLGNGLGTTVFQWEDISDMTPANVNMSGVTPAEQDRVSYDLNSIPLPIIHKEFHINIRALEASRRLGQPLDTTQVEVATRTVSEQIENILLNGASALTFGGGTLRGYRDHGDRNTVSLVLDWADSTATGQDMLDDVLAMKQASINDRHFGPWMLYLPTNFDTVIDNDFKANSDKTIRQRILEVEGIAGIRIADALPDSEVVMVQMSRSTVAMVVGMEPTVVQWETQGGMIQHFKVMAIMVPRLASDHNGNMGLVHLS